MSGLHFEVGYLVFVKVPKYLYISVKYNSQNNCDIFHASDAKRFKYTKIDYYLRTKRANILSLNILRSQIKFNS